MPKVVPEYKDEARKKIIVAALEVMGTKGYHDTTMDDIAAHLGVSKGAIYLYFKTRDELLAAFMAKMQQQNYEAAIRIFPKAKPLESWTALFDQYMQLDDQFNALFFEIIAAATRNRAVKEIVANGIMTGVEYAARGITRQQEKGLIHPGADPRSVAIAIMSMFIGMRSLVMLGADRDEVRLQWSAVGRILLGIGEETEDQVEERPLP
ncbi:MAG: TetR/AcrR family transcriptional regulator [Methanospirillum sp.]